MKREKIEKAQIPVGYHRIRPQSIYLKNKKPCALIGDNGVHSESFNEFVREMHERGHFRRNGENVRVYIVARHNRDQRRFYVEARIDGALYGMEITSNVIYSPPQEDASPAPHFALST